MPRTKKKNWSQSFGVYGSKIRLAELSPGGILYLLWVGADRKQRKRSLGHRDRKRGKEEALAVASQLASHRETVETGRVTVGVLVEKYLAEGLHGRTARHRTEVARKLRLWRSFLGDNRPVQSLSPSDVERFGSARLAGEISAAGKSPSVVSQTTVWHDFVALMTALNFGCAYRDFAGNPLIASNPLRGVKVSKTVSPARPVADDDFYLALRGVADRLPASFIAVLDLAYATGHRTDAILKLQWSDISFAEPEHAPHGTIRWRAENDKIANEHTVPMNDRARRALLAVAKDRAEIGESWVFPSPTDGTKKLERHLASRWLRRAERLANIEHVKGRGWHSFRRQWASELRHLPDTDVAAAGGWKDVTTMKRCYQHADAAGVLRVVTGRKDAASA